ncbi:unnamed protein product, partial [Allacma fusca]
GLVSQVVLDYMHMCCLGITRKLIITSILPVNPEV